MICFNCQYDIPIILETYSEVIECPSCKALYSEMITFLDSLNYVLLEYHEGKIPFDQVRAFEFSVLVVKGEVLTIDSRKGWFDPLTKKMVHRENITDFCKDCLKYPCSECDSETITLQCDYRELSIDSLNKLEKSQNF